MTYWNKEEVKPHNPPTNIFSSRRSRGADPKTDAIKRLNADIYNFSKVNSFSTPLEAAEAFRMKWAGYKRDYSLDQITQAFKIVMK
jgi:hypothetical protein